MGLVRLKNINPAMRPPLPVMQDALVIGGGIAGMTAALTIADHGYKVVLVEKEAQSQGICHTEPFLYLSPGGQYNELTLSKPPKSRGIQTCRRPFPGVCTAQFADLERGRRYFAFAGHGGSWGGSPSCGCVPTASQTSRIRSTRLLSSCR